MHEFSSAQYSVEANHAIDAQWIHIGFTLNSLWAIRLLNRFESGFSVNRPLVSLRSASAYILAHRAGLDGQTLLENSIH